ncbi:MAG: tRNA (adenosine(37)-N6)-threonylcarbamoyltransferase complex dimerization subunit type 1 TsaB [Eubacterium sp.]|nr:tRNA (adenosine(37)-N6)-threonylcarbamoyltransferase complex dimerization subunit type 1 TsaB [Eubacterium sp.]
MKILGIDSSGMVASVAIVSDDVVIAEYTMNHKKTHSETLLPMIDEIVKTSEFKLEELDAIAIASGPGSFTGLRIGAATAKGLALAIDKPIVTVKTCEGLAFNMWGAEGLVCPIIDARRNQVYTGLYQVQGNVNVIMDQEPMDIHELIEKINTLAHNVSSDSILSGEAGVSRLGEPAAVTFLGDGVPIYEETIWLETKVPCKMAPANMNRQRASSIATYGAILYKEGKYVNSDDFAPEYLRKSQAERVKEEKEGTINEKAE